MPGPPPKPAHLRQRRNKKRAGAAAIGFSDEKPHGLPDIPNPDERIWHALTVAWWAHVWASPMASQYLETDVDGLGRIAMLVDEYYRKPAANLLAELRLQEARFGLSPIDRRRLEWEIKRGEEADRKRPPTPARGSGGDPRRVLRMAVLK